MFKVIVERPRRGSRWIPSAKVDPDGTRDGGFVGLRRYARQEAWTFKSFNENLAPLARFLRSRCGRPWNDVYAEICATLDTGSTVKMHVREHIDDLVHRRISYGRQGEMLNDGHPLVPWRAYSMRDDLYVDPDDGILKDAETFWGSRGVAVPSRRVVRARAVEKSTDLRRIDDTHFAWRRAESWFLVAFDRRPHLGNDDLLTFLVAGQREAPAVRTTERGPTGEWVHRWTFEIPSAWRVVGLRQLCKKALRQYGLVGGEHD
jgi:hypothetical protein